MTQNIKQNAIEAMYEAHRSMPGGDVGTIEDYFGPLLDAALTVLAAEASEKGLHWVVDWINHVKVLET